MFLVINADDFGMDAETNKAIAFCFLNDLITNTTAMVNMPSFQDGLSLAKDDGFLEKIGLHVNLFEGLPLSDAIRSVPLFFDSSKNSLTSGILQKTEKKFFLSSKETEAVAEEVKMQFQKYVLSGLNEMHFDSHGHSHTCWSLWKIIRKEAELNRFISSRLSLNLGNKKNPLKKIYKSVFNHNLARRFVTTDFLLISAVSFLIFLKFL